MNPKGPVIVLDLLPEERSRLLDVLGSLSPNQWVAPTSCPGWSVKDVAADIPGDDLNNPSGGRDRYADARSRSRLEGDAALADPVPRAVAIIA